MNTRKPFAWQKKGLVYADEIPGFTFASHPCVYHLKDDEFLLAFTRRDEKQHSNIFLTRAHVANGNVTLTCEPRLALTPGAPGTFDCDGAASMCMVEDGGQIYLYYGSWQNLPAKGMWIAESGRVRVNLEKMVCEREFEGPVFGRCIDEPLWGTGPCLMKEGNQWHVWYVSLDRWEPQSDGTFKHFYNLKHRYSDDGIQWNRGRTTCIDFANELECSIACPSVLHEPGKPYQMWYSFREQPGINTYRIGYAESQDGIEWTRLDNLAGIDVSPTGWDSEMICYGHVFKHKDYTYMLYNGNAYGKTGFGLAVLKDA